MHEKRAVCYEELIDTIRPTCQQMNDWSTKFDNLLHDEGGRKLFTEFLHQEHSLENLQFWSEVETLKAMCDEPQDVAMKARTVYADYVKPMSEKEVNICGITRRKIEEGLQLDIIDANIFNVAQAQVYSLMHRQSYPRFLLSDLYKSVLQSTYADHSLS
jgi:regulator of G-protein signaling